MAVDVWLGIGLGAAIGAVYGATSFVVQRRALRSSERAFLPIVLGSMAVRMFVALLLVALILALVPVSHLAFVGTFLGVFVLGLAVDIVMLGRYRPG